MYLLLGINRECNQVFDDVAQQQEQISPDFNPAPISQNRKKLPKNIICTPLKSVLQLLWNDKTGQKKSVNLSEGQIKS